MFQAWATGHPKVNPACTGIILGSCHALATSLPSRSIVMMCDHGGLCKLAFHAIIVTFSENSRQCLILLSNAYCTDLLVL